MTKRLRIDNAMRGGKSNEIDYLFIPLNLLSADQSIARVHGSAR